MRRRDFYRLPPAENSKPRPPEPPPAPELQPVMKGTCPHCLQYIGRGVHFHARSCGKR